jgi:hypothetical protein
MQNHTLRLLFAYLPIALPWVSAAAKRTYAFRIGRVWREKRFTLRPESALSRSITRNLRKGDTAETKTCSWVGYIGVKFLSEWKKPKLVFRGVASLSLSDWTKAFDILRLNSETARLVTPKNKNVTHPESLYSGNVFICAHFEVNFTSRMLN